jgi:hypothetical protein
MDYDKMRELPLLENRADPSPEHFTRGFERMCRSEVCVGEQARLPDPDDLRKEGHLLEKGANDLDGRLLAKGEDAFTEDGSVAVLAGRGRGVSEQLIDSWINAIMDIRDAQPHNPVLVESHKRVLQPFHLFTRCSLVLPVMSIPFEFLDEIAEDRCSTTRCTDDQYDASLTTLVRADLLCHGSQSYGISDNVAADLQDEDRFFFFTFFRHDLPPCDGLSWTIQDTATQLKIQTNVKKSL